MAVMSALLIARVVILGYTLTENYGIAFVPCLMGENSKGSHPRPPRYTLTTAHTPRFRFQADVALHIGRSKLRVEACDLVR